MKTSFTIGAVSGMSALALAIPMFAQVSGAQVFGTGSSEPVFFKSEHMRPDFSQDGIQARIENDTAFLEHADEIIAVLKDATQTHRDALTLATDIADGEERQDAVRDADEAFRASLHAAIEADPDLKNAMHLGMMPGMGKRVLLRGHGPEHLAQKFGMTPEELKAAIESGKTIKEIAEEKDVELQMERVFLRKDDASSTQ